jgi:hypothetical protein
MSRLFLRHRGRAPTRPRPPGVLHRADSHGFWRSAVVGTGYQLFPANSLVYAHLQVVRRSHRTNRQGGGHWFEPSIAHYYEDLATAGHARSALAICPVRGGQERTQADTVCRGFRSLRPPVGGPAGDAPLPVRGTRRARGPDRRQRGTVALGVLSAQSRSATTSAISRRCSGSPSARDGCP